MQKDPNISIPRPNFTMFPNVILDNLELFDLAEIAVLCLICRRTIGWHRETAEISASFFDRKSGASASTAKRALGRLIDRGLVVKKISHGRSTYGLNLEPIDDGAEITEPIAATKPSKREQTPPPSEPKPAIREPAPSMPAPKICASNYLPKVGQIDLGQNEPPSRGNGASKVGQIEPTRVGQIEPHINIRSKDKGTPKGVSSGKPKTVKEKPLSKRFHPDAQLFLDRWEMAYKEHFGVDYIPQPKDKGAANSILFMTKMAPIPLVEIARKAWARGTSGPRFFNCGRANTLTWFANRFNEIRAELVAPMPSAPQVPAKDQFWRHKQELEMVEAELKKIRDGASHNALGPEWTDDERARRKPLLERRRQLRQELKLEGVK